MTITQPRGFASNLTGVVALQASSSDASIARVEFQIDGTPLRVDDAPPFDATVDSSAFASGQHVLRARGFDTMGNASAWSSTTVQFGGTRAQPAGFTRDTGYVSGLSSATALAELPDGRLLITQQGGTLRVWNGTAMATMLTLPVDSQGERGLLGVAVHPNFNANGFIYVYYTTTQGGAHNRISRFTVSGNTTGNEVVLVNLPALSSATNHNGGALHFGPDGKLYAGVGENANGANAQDLSIPLGKMLRFNDDGSIPQDNPFCTTQGNLACAVWAYGLRNPFTFAFQPGTGRMHINDVGQSTWEEIDLGVAGANYGWPNSEGSDNVGAGVAAPLFAYRHGAPVPSGPGGFFTGIAIIGGAFYPDSGMFPVPWRGGYFFSDLGSAFVGFIDLNNDNAAYAFGSVPGSPVGMLVASDGALLVLTQSSVIRFAIP
ncbi:MAG TPA: PQQ-dependent sugar dehydrogenase [Burkholderiaceae bacterium]|nr:PQQ-dependent sugar dehydrogenase [Burkholderiaceae bacterium]